MLTGPWPGASAAGSWVRSSYRALQLDLLVPGREVREREERVRAGRGVDAEQGREDVAAVERAVAGVEEGEVAGGVAGRRRSTSSEPTFARPRSSGSASSSRPGSRLLTRRARPGLHRLVAAEQDRVAGGDQDLGIGESGGEGVERADVVAVGMGEDDPDDRGPEVGGGGEDLLGAALDHRVDQRQPVVLLDEECVDHAVAADPGVALDRWNAHGADPDGRRRTPPATPAAGRLATADESRPPRRGRPQRADPARGLAAAAALPVARGSARQLVGDRPRRRHRPLRYRDRRRGGASINSSSRSARRS